MSEKSPAKKAGKGGQKPRKHKVSNGVHGAKRHHLTEVEKVLMNKGIYRTMRRA